MIHSGMAPDRFEHVGDEDVVREALRAKDLFGVLVRRYQDRLSRYIRRLGVSRHEDMEDVLQNVFIKTYRNLNGFDPSLRFSSWIYRITHNETMSFFRAKRARPEVLPGEDDDVIERIPAMLDIEGDINRGYDAAIVGRALNKLDPKYRDVLILRFFEERDYADISDVLRLPMGTVATLLSRGKKKLKELLADQPV